MDNKELCYKSEIKNDLLSNHLKSLLGNIDIYLFDQILKGNFDNMHTLLDCGCGKGRNLDYFHKNNFEVYGVDNDHLLLEEAKKNALRIDPKLSLKHFQVADGTHLPFKNNYFDIVLSIAVLHFSENFHQFLKITNEMWRVLKPGGILFVRQATVIGIEDYIKPLKNNWYKLPDGTERFLINKNDLYSIFNKLGGKLLDPLKTTNVDDLRSMTTWSIQKL